MNDLNGLPFSRASFLCSPRGVCGEAADAYKDIYACLDSMDACVIVHFSGMFTKLEHVSQDSHSPGICTGQHVERCLYRGGIGIVAVVDHCVFPGSIRLLRPRIGTFASMPGQSACLSCPAHICRNSGKRIGHHMAAGDIDMRMETGIRSNELGICSFQPPAYNLVRMEGQEGSRPKYTGVIPFPGVKLRSLSSSPFSMIVPLGFI